MRRRKQKYNAEQLEFTWAPIITKDNEMLRFIKRVDEVAAWQAHYAVGPWSERSMHPECCNTCRNRIVIYFNQL